jgi:cell division protein YceG involved in septum cleavage
LSPGHRSRSVSQRTDEQREQAREERARRRAQRQGEAAAKPDDPPVPEPADAPGLPPAAARDEPAPAPRDEPAPGAQDPPAPAQAAEAEPGAGLHEPDAPATPPAGEQRPAGAGKGEAGALGAPPSSDGGPPADGGRGHRPRIRALALLAIAAVAAVVLVLLVSSGSGSHHTSTVSGPKIVKVLIPEGETRLQIAQIASRLGLTGSYRAESRRSPLLDPGAYGAPRSTPDLEGFLFPATYDMYAGGPVSRLVQAQLVAFHENFGVTEISRARALHVTPYQLLTVASMVEREARVPADRAKIAAVIYNRLRRHMPLGVDATLYYAIELRTGVPTITRELTQAELELDSPYNTRTREGLPPTPIANPGAASIHAAAYPAHVPYLYYVLAPDGCGEHVFSTTAAEFAVHAAAFREALRANHGHLPTCTKH